MVVLSTHNAKTNVPYEARVIALERQRIWEVQPWFQYGRASSSCASMTRPEVFGTAEEPVEGVED